ncbi:hypothetical protein BGP_2089 [Beggiatoa sp. PS]|nr:hypothetical protein BGP_2089 [Beggiatoa sp. PS]
MYTDAPLWGVSIGYIAIVHLNTQTEQCVQLKERFNRLHCHSSLKLSTSISNVNQKGFNRLHCHSSLKLRLELTKRHLKCVHFNIIKNKMQDFFLSYLLITLNDK